MLIFEKKKDKKTNVSNASVIRRLKTRIRVRNGMSSTNKNEMIGQFMRETHTHTHQLKWLLQIIIYYY